MKKILLFTVILLVFLSAASAEDYDWVYKVKDAEFDVKTSSLLYRGRDVSDISADLTLYPRETYRETVLSQSSDPPVGQPYIFSWRSPGDERLDFSVQSIVRTENVLKKITAKVPFPRRDNFDRYTHSTETIDSDDPKIISLATGLAAGEDDQYIVVHKIAEWVGGNIQYSLDTVTEKASQRSSWVLENRRGVCDELTNLFIAMLRSLDIPARFVAGTAYTNTGELEGGWGPHGWAEVYYPGHGWVPYDITYRQFGWLDLSHITMKESADSMEPSVRYSWTGSDIDTGPLDIDVEVLGHSEFEPDRIDLDLDILNRQTGFGSYNLLKVTVRNKKGYYQTVKLRTLVSDTLELLDRSYKMVALRPGEARTVCWRLRVKDDLDPYYKYTSFAKVESFEEEETIEFASMKEDRTYSESEIEDAVEDIEESEDMTYSHDIQVSCDIEDRAFYMYETKEVLCEVENTGSREHYNLRFCFREDCTDLDLAIGQRYTKRFEFRAKQPGEQDLKFIIANPDIFNVDIIPITVYQAPELDIQLDYPESLEYDDTMVLNFSVAERTSDIQDADIKVLLGDKVLQEDSVEDLTSQRFILRIPATYLKRGENMFSIQIRYRDYNGKRYKKVEQFSVRLVNVTFFQNLKLFFRQLFH